MGIPSSLELVGIEVQQIGENQNGSGWFTVNRQAPLLVPSTSRGLEGDKLCTAFVLIPECDKITALRFSILPFQLELTSILILGYLDVKKREEEIADELVGSLTLQTIV